MPECLRITVTLSRIDQAYSYPQSIAKRITALEGLRKRTRQATSEFYQKPGVMPPPLAPRIIVRDVGENNFLLIERATGKTVSERISHNNASDQARELEAKMAQYCIKRFGKALRHWALRIGTILPVFVFFSSHR